MLRTTVNAILSVSRPNPSLSTQLLERLFFCGQWFVQIGETLFIVNQPVVYVNKNDETCADKTPCYTSIQQAINTSSDGTVIKIVEGNYEENITLNTSKTLTLKGWYDSTFHNPGIEYNDQRIICCQQWKD